MNQIYYAIVVGLPIWWAAQTVLFLRDYVRQRNEAKTRQPLTEEEKVVQKAELVKLESELPRKEWHPPGRYFFQTKDGAKLGAGITPIS